MEVVIPIELGLPIECTTLAYANAHFASIELFLDLADEGRTSQPYRWSLTTNRSWCNITKRFGVENFILRISSFDVFLKIQKSQRMANLALTGKGPHWVTHVMLNNAYHLEALDGKACSRPWNVLHLMKFYSRR